MRRRLVFALVLLCAVPRIVTAQEADRFEALIGLARVHRDAGDPVAARTYFEQARQVRPLTPAERAEYFWVLAGLDAPAAVPLAVDVLAATPGDHALRERAVVAAVAAGDEGSVERLAGDGERVEPDTALWPRQVAESAMRQGRPLAAGRAYRRAVTRADADDSDRAGLAMALESAGRYADAADAWHAVSPQALAAHPDWTTSALRAGALGRPGAATAAALDAWVQAHPADRPMRELLVETWAQAGEPARALVAIGPLRSGPDADAWTRRAVDLAVDAGDTARAVADLRDLVATDVATPADRLRLIDMLTTIGAQADAATMIDAQLDATPCDDALLTRLDRLPDELATSRLIAHVSAHLDTCVAEPGWVRRAIDRAVAASRLDAALPLVEALPLPDATDPSVRRLHGQLLVWTGQPGAAVPILEGVLAERPGDDESRNALVDAWRAMSRPYEAWAVARPLLTTSLSVDRRRDLAGLALEADRPAAALAIGADLPTDVSTLPAWRDLAGRALLASGRPAEAWRALSGIDPAVLSPAGALALVDSTSDMRGRAAAREVAAGFTETTRPWLDVLARRYTLEATAGRADTAAALRASLATLDDVRAVLADAEVALGREEPALARDVLDGLVEVEGDDRAVDLYATALAGTGDLSGALTLVERLRRTRPELPSFAIREAELAYRQAPTVAARTRVLRLPVRYAGNVFASLAAVRMLAGEGHDAEALERAGPPGTWHDLPLDGRVAVARSLRGLGRFEDALDLVEDLDGAAGAAATLRAELIATVRGRDEGTAAFRGLTSAPEVTPSVYLAWASAAGTAVERVRVLEDARSRFPAHANVLAALASARLSAGDYAGADEAAASALAVDPQQLDAWRIRVTAAMLGHAGGQVVALMEAFARQFDGAPASLVAMADHVAGYVSGPGDPALAPALAWTADLAGGDQADPAAGLARARLLAAGESWDGSVSAVDDVLATSANLPVALRLRADLLSWAGRYDEALAAYDTVLRVTPGDLAAARQQARVLGWAGRFAEANAHYRALEATYADRAGLAAEARAKAAFFAGRWRDAIPAYEAWLQVEPAETEARFELAEAQRNAGEIAASDRTRDRLAGMTPPHRLAVAAEARTALDRAPAVAALMEHSSAAGYQGRRLLTLDRQGGRLSTTFGPAAATALGVDVSRVRAAAGRLSDTGVATGVDLTHRFTPDWALEGRAGLLDVAGSGAMADLRAQVAWRPTDRWSFAGGLDRTPLLENLDAIAAGVGATSAFGQAAFSSPDFDLEARWSRASLSDGNARRRMGVFASRIVDPRWRQLRAVVWTEHVAYARTSTLYFAPEGFLRVDAGAEYTHLFSRPRFSGDRERSLTLGYLAGVDSRGTFYAHPSVRAAFELQPTLVLDVRADWIRSADYDETSLAVGLRVRNVPLPGLR